MKVDKCIPEFAWKDEANGQTLQAINRQVGHQGDSELSWFIEDLTTDSLIAQNLDVIPLFMGQLSDCSLELADSTNSFGLKLTMFKDSDGVITTMNDDE